MKAVDESIDQDRDEHEDDPWYGGQEREESKKKEENSNDNGEGHTGVFWHILVVSTINAHLLQ